MLVIREPLTRIESIKPLSKLKIEGIAELQSQLINYSLNLLIAETFQEHFFQMYTVRVRDYTDCLKFV